jgi:hypothetical protein
MQTDALALSKLSSFFSGFVYKFVFSGLMSLSFSLCLVELFPDSQLYTQKKVIELWKRDHPDDLCADCHGEGKVICPTCKGTGRDPAELDA